MEMKLFNLQKENELKAISNLIPVVRNLCRTTMAWTIKVDEPFILRRYDDIYIILDEIHNSSRMVYSRDLYKVLQHAPADTKVDFSDILTDPQKYCSVHFEFFWTRIGEDNEVANYLYKALTEISLDKESFEYMKKRGYNVSEFSKSNLWLRTNGEDRDAYTFYYFRNNYETIVNAIVEINKAIREEKLSFHLIDNTGEYSDFKALEYLSFKEGGARNWDKAEIKNGNFGTEVFKIPDSDFYFTWKNGSTASGICGFNDSGLFRNLFVTDPLKDEDGCFYGFSRHGEGALYVFDDYPAKGVEVYHQNRKDRPSLSIYVIIPTSEIGKYSSFKIEPK